MNLIFALLGVFILNTSGSSLVLDATEGREARIVWYGARLQSEDAAQLRQAGFASQSAYPAYGLKGTAATALSAIQADGNHTLDLRVVSVQESEWEHGRRIEILSRDAVYPFTVKNVFLSFTDEDIIETWAEISNLGKKPVELTRYDSGCLSIHVGEVWMSSLYGTWANEGRLCEEPLTRGWKVISNIDGTRNSHTSHAEVMFSLDGKPQENAGRVIGAALEWGGDYELRVQTDDTDYHKFLAGINPDNSEIKLTRDETFTTPRLAYSFSGEGLSGVSRNFHRWGRNYRLAHGDKERKVLLNSWEGVYFDINEPGMEQMMSDIASMGGELFVMDDGWFGDKYPRKNDSSSLGDWVVDKSKLPGGIPHLVQAAEERGIKFGIWIEPEMTNSVSELYEAHPDWIIKAASREPVYGRGGTQLVLDLSNPAVQDHVFGIVDRLMKENPGLDYIKWDSNMDINVHGSQYLKEQGRLDTEYWKGLAKVLDRIRAAYPDLTIQACASGGGRANWGVLPWFDEFWTSDNTDALQRIYMQWGTSYFFPAIAMASHISATPNHTVYRTTSIKFRCDVAMSGRLGMEIQPAGMTDKEKEICRQAISDYKKVRPIVQFGDIYRLVSPYDGKFASLMYATPAKDKAVLYWWKIANFYDEHFPAVRLCGLDPDRKYVVRELNRVDLRPMAIEGKVFTGRFLMENGLVMPASNDVEWSLKSDWSSRVLYLEAM